MLNGLFSNGFAIVHAVILVTTAITGSITPPDIATSASMLEDQTAQTDSAAAGCLAPRILLVPGVQAAPDDVVLDLCGVRLTWDPGMGVLLCDLEKQTVDAVLGRSVVPRELLCDQDLATAGTGPVCKILDIVAGFVATGGVGVPSGESCPIDGPATCPRTQLLTNDRDIDGFLADASQCAIACQYLGEMYCAVVRQLGRDLMEFGNETLLPLTDEAYETLWSLLHLDPGRERAERASSSGPFYLSESRCRTAETIEAEGDWDFAFATQPDVIFLSSAGAFPDTGTAGGYAQYSLSVADEGTVRQTICYDAGGFSESFPETRRPPSADEISSAQADCNRAKLVIWFGVGVFAVGVLMGHSGLVIAGALTAGAGAAEAARSCDYAKDLASDPGWMHCEGAAGVSWGPSNQYESTLLNLQGGMVGFATSATSSGDGYYEESFPVYYNAADYWKGLASCEAQLLDARQAAFDRYQQWGTTAGNGTAEISVSLSVDSLITDKVDLAGAVLVALVPEAKVFYDAVRHTILVPCQGMNPCSMNVLLEVTACGTQAVEGGSEQVQYSFVSRPGCTEAVVTINGRPLAVVLPLTMDVTIGGSGGSEFA